MDRRLAAILCADLVGYSRLMHLDEAGTLERLRTSRAEVFDPLIARHQGRIVKLMGDGALVEFASVVVAVECAVEIQRAMRARNSGLAPEKRIEFRIGINLGDVIVEENDLYGDGVNIASRLQEKARPGGICISRPVHTQVRDKLALEFQSLGMLRIRNIPQPVSAFEVVIEADGRRTVRTVTGRRIPRRLVQGASALGVLALAAGIAWLVTTSGPALQRASPAAMAYPLPDAPSIAVLPFFAGEATPAEVATGLATDLASTLSRLPAAFVISAGSAIRVGGGTATVKEAAEGLGVRYVVTVEVEDAGQRLETRIRLTDAIDAGVVWVGKYDASPGGLLSWLTGSAGDITRLLAIGQPPRTLPEGLDAGAYLAYLRGLAAFHRQTRAGNVAAAEAFDEATRLGPGFAAPLGWRAWADLHAMIREWDEPTQDALDRAGSSARAAIALDGAEPVGHWALGAMHMVAGEYRPAGDRMRDALALNPNDADVLAGLTKVLAILGDADEAVGLGLRALRLNPFAPVWYRWNLGVASYHAGRFEDAAKQFGGSPVLNREARLYHIASLVRSGRGDAVAEHVDAILEAHPLFSVSGFIDAQLGMQPGRAQALAGDLLRAGLPNEVPWECLVRPETCRARQRRL